MVTPVATYREASHQLLAQAQVELAAGGLRQSSEELWGATAQIIKAIAEARDWDHYSHYLLIRTVANLVAETGDAEIDTLFGVAQSLHTNFYENWLLAELVENRVNSVRQFIGKLDPMLDS